MDGNKWAASAALIAAVASAYSAYQSGSAARESAIAAADSNKQVAALQKATTDRQSDIAMVKLALNILGGEISDKTQESRRFAVSILRKYSGVEIDGVTGSTWAEVGTVSFAEKRIGLSSALANDPDIAKIQRISDAIIAGMLTEKLKKLNSEQPSHSKDGPD